VVCSTSRHGSTFSRGGGDGACLIDVNCPEGDPFAQSLDPLAIGLTSIDGFDPENPSGGPGGVVPAIASISPSVIEAVNPASPQAVTINGTGFDGTTSVELDGVPLGAFPPEFVVQNNSTIVISLLPLCRASSMQLLATGWASCSS